MFKKVILSNLLLLFVVISNGQITITPGGTAATIVSNLAGSGIQMSNVVINCGPTAYGTYTGNLGAGGVGLSNGGIVLTTGSAAGADGPNGSGSTSTAVPGYDFADPQLTTQPGAGNPPPSNDNCILEFDMIPACGSLSLSFVFGSEEYPEFVTGSFNDGFGIFVSGPDPAGGTYNNYNMARLPNGQLVSIDNVNANVNSGYYNSNTAGIMQYDGYTDGLLATINTTPCASYHVKIIIADAGDQSWDSGLFLGYQSFQCATPPFTVTPSITGSICGPNGAASINVTGGVGPFLYSWTGVTGQPTNGTSISNVNAGSYSVTVTDQGLCNSTFTTPIVIPNNPVPPVLSPVTAQASCGCNGSINLNITGGVAPYNIVWTGGLSGSNPTNLCPGNYSVTVTGANNCSVTQAFNITNTQAIVTAAAVVPTFCAGGSTTITAASGANYVWSPSAGLNTTSGPTVTANPIVSTTYTVTSTLNGCVQTVNIPITVNPLPVLTLNSPTICVGETATLTATPSVLGGGNIVWSPVGLMGSSITVSPTSTTTYTPFYFANGCGNVPVQTTVTVNPIPTITVTDDVICNGEAASITATPDLAGGIFNWSTSEQSATISPSPTTTTTYDVTYTLNNCTSPSVTSTVNVNALPSTNLSTTLPLCEGGNLELFSGDVPNGLYDWTGPNMFVSNEQNPMIDNVSLLNAGTYTLTITAENCSSDFSIDIVIDSQTPSLIDPISPLCVSASSIDLNSPNEPGLWSGVGITDLLLGTFDPATSGSGEQIITFDSDAYCTSPSELTIEIFEQYDATITQPSPLCNDADALTLTTVDTNGTWTGTGVDATGTISPSNLTPGFYSAIYEISGLCGNIDSISFEILNVPDGTITPAGPFCQFDLPQNLTANTPGGTWSGPGITSSSNGTFGNTNTPENTYTITYTLGGQCGGSWNTDIIVYENIDATINNAGPFCENEPIFNLTTLNAGGVWSGTGAITANGAIDPGVLGPNTYTFNYDINNNGCLTHDEIDIVIHPLPVVSFDADILAGCAPLSVSFQNTSVTASTSCVWWANGQPIGNGCSNFNYTFNDVGCFDIQLTNTDGNGCSSSTSFADYICTVNPPVASFTWLPTTPATVDPEVNFTNLSLGNLINNWTINGQTNSEINPIYFMPSDIAETFDACLSVEGLYGCTDQVCYTITVDREEFIFVPNSFTPDQDGINDVFMPVMSGVDEENPSYYFAIYNRWGDVIFETTDYKQAWTGNVHDGDYYAQDGVYLWVLKVKLSESDLTREMQGHVTLVR